MPPDSATPSAALLADRLIQTQPYALTSDDVLFSVYAERKGLPPSQRPQARVAFFAKPQACASDLGKRHGWGIHSNSEGNVARVGVETPEYQALVSGARPGQPGQTVVVKYAMRSKRATAGSR